MKKAAKNTWKKSLLRIALITLSTSIFPKTISALSTRSFKAIFYGNYSYAQDQLQSARKSAQGKSKVIYFLRLWLILFKIFNNEAIANLYNGRVEEAKDILLSYEELPPEAIFINVGTISELISTTGDDLKKQLFAKNCDKMSDLFDPQSIKLNV